MTVRKNDRNGYLVVGHCNVHRAGVFEYPGSEIIHGWSPGSPPSWIEATKMYGVLRHPDELRKPECLESFQAIPLIDEHTWLGRDGAPPEDVGVHGVTLTDAEWRAPFISVSLKIFSESLMGAIRDGKVELSPGFTAPMVPQKGVYDGKAYSFVMNTIRANHLALVWKGRNGPEVKVADGAFCDRMPLVSREDKVMDEEQLKVALAETQKPVIEALTMVAEQLKALGEKVGAATTAGKDGGNGTGEDGGNGTGEDGSKVTDGAAIVSQFKGLLDGFREDFKKEMQSSVADGARKASLYERVKTHVGVFDHAAMSSEQLAEYAISKLKASGKASITADKGQAVAHLSGWLDAQVSQPTDAGAGFFSDAHAGTAGGAFDISKAMQDILKGGK